MTKHFRTLRPVGNNISLCPQQFDKVLFYPFKYQFYQSGTASLAAAMIASQRIKSHISKPEVIIPAYACPDLVSAIIFSGATPVLVDLEPNRPWMSIENILNAITSNTTALVAVNFLGIAERMDRLQTICREYNIILIEDSAQGFPVTRPDTYWYGDFNIVSFGRGKPVNLLSGGAVLCRDNTLLNLLPAPTPVTQALIAGPKYRMKVCLYNISINPFIYNIISRLPGLNIGKTIYKPLTGIFNMPAHASKLLFHNINLYAQHANYGDSCIDYLSHISSSKLRNLVSVIQHNHNKPLLRYPFLVNNKKLRDKLYINLKPYGSSLMYQQPLNQIEGVPHYLANPNETFPNATAFSNSLITLPLHKGITYTDLQSIHNILKKHLN